MGAYLAPSSGFAQMQPPDNFSTQYVSLQWLLSAVTKQQALSIYPCLTCRWALRVLVP